jgi:DNA helicase-2/ATP-dependent DNA helicase PcrA
MYFHFTKTLIPMQTVPTEIFRQRYERLNPEQKQAVETIDGPVMVIAGPGTGKTEVLAARIANILQKDIDIKAENILCLTFTNAGVIAMRQRLIQYLGAEAHHVAIHTFHSFCNEIVQNHPEAFGVRELEPVEDLAVAQFLEQVIDGFNKDHPLFSKSGYYYLYHLKQLIATLKQENWSVTDVQEAITKYLEECKNSPDFYYKRKTGKYQKGDFNENKYQKEAEKMRKLEAGLQVFEQYQKWLAETGRYDYQDMILWVVREFQQGNTLLQQYQERYQYMLVDEYQDSSGAQNQIIEFLADFWERPNLFVVGDDDQSIYRFQGANIENLLKFYRKYQPQLLCLSKNYRSHQRILDVADKVIDANQERIFKQLTTASSPAGRIEEGVPELLPSPLSPPEGGKSLVITKTLTAANPKYQQQSAQITVNAYATSTQQEADLVQTFKQLKEQSFPLHEVAVLYRQHRQVENLLKLCEYEQIPVQVKQLVNILELPVVENILQILSYVRDELEQSGARDDLLFRILHFPTLNLPIADLARLWQFVRNQNTRDNKQRFSLRDVLTNQTLLAEANFQENEYIQEVTRKLEKLLQTAVSGTLQQLLEVILTDFGFLNWSQQQAENSWYLRVYSTLFDYLKNLTRRQPQLTLTEYLQIISQMQTHTVPLNLTKTTFQQQGVQFLTCHSAKGLEFEKVYLMGLNKQYWESGRKPRGFTFPPTLQFQQSADDHDEEELRRLLFVALTRAKTGLHLSFAEQDDETQRLLEQSRFVDEVLAADTELKLQHKTVSEEAINTLLIGKLSSLPKLHEEYIDHAYVDQRLQNWQMSFSSLNKFLHCPLSFYFEDMLRVPQAASTAAGFGRAVHVALEQFFRNPQNNLVTLFTEQLRYQRASFSEAEFTRFMGYGQKILQQYVEHYQGKWAKEARLEYRIKTEITGVPVVGVLDKVEFLSDGSANVVDYKTGKMRKDKLLRPSENEDLPLGGDHWRQLAFYKALTENDALQQWHVVSGEIDFVEPYQEKFYKPKILFTPQDVEQISQQVADAHERIHQHDFLHGCDEEYCRWCGFVRQLKD